jgi:hypothetical protein
VEHVLESSRKDRRTRETLENALNLLKCSDEAEIQAAFSGAFGRHLQGCQDCYSIPH